MEPNRPDSVERFELVPITRVFVSLCLKIIDPKKLSSKKRRLIYNEHQKQRNDGALHGLPVDGVSGLGISNRINNWIHKTTYLNLI